MSIGEAPCAIATPKPMKNRAAINMPMFTEMLCNITPKTIMMQPMRMPALRPRMSAVYGTQGMAQMEPMDMIALRIPRVDPFG